MDRGPRTNRAAVRAGIVGALLVAPLLCTAAVAAHAAPSTRPAIHAAERSSELRTALDEKGSRYASWRTSRDDAASAIADARAELEGTAGRVLDEGTRTTLAAAIRTAEQRLLAASATFENTFDTDLHATLATGLRVATSLGADPVGEQLAAMRAQSLPAVGVDLTRELESVRASVTAQQEAEAAARAAEARAADAARRAAQAVQAAARASAASAPAITTAAASAPAPAESADARIARLMAANGLTVTARVGGCTTPNASGCYLPTTGYITITSRGLGAADCRLQHILAHEWRHWWQDQQGWWSATRWASVEEAEADANAFAAAYGCG